MTVYDWACSIWRMVVPVIAGWIVTLLVQINVDVDEQSLSNALVAGFVIVYYGLFRTLESKVSPVFGWFLGLARPPAYPPKPAPEPTLTTKQSNAPYGPPPT
ncbi:hypothetical protein [Streptomyces malaysiensis]|uniref:Uncharacterized protein n=1 Tax=Streptomyces malaysiensis TaxID=92644 RepID=A0A7X5X7K2_STRMQ|nr:hypothetical protein [Streptomyces malaysiensis]NIY68007.1 hypothetical protein [Streptomyces malaysiensis]